MVASETLAGTARRRSRSRRSTLQIAEFGEPAFVKIDVEGYESEVLSGLSRGLKAGSIEFAAESLDATSCCLDKLESTRQLRIPVRAS